MMRTLSPFIIACIALLTTVPAVAQNYQTVNFSTLSWGRLINDLHYRNVDGEVVQLWIPNGAPSENYTYTGTLPIQFFRITGKDGEGNPIEEVAGTYTPANNRQHLLIFIANEDKRTYRVLPIEFNPETTPENNYRFINLSTFPVYVKFGDDRFRMNPRGEESINVQVGSEGGMDIAMAIQVSEQPGDAKIAYSSAWSMRNGRSALVFVTTNFGKQDKIDVKKLYF